ncbi:hypothetical protein [Rhodococcus sp. NPDC058481]|uniref:hypothetical protein n=1 Tax=unclassified Rhodococcus (in: high G+C Gram-positive bacteria) TaxID=192944 RepID=UPI00364BBCA1
MSTSSAAAARRSLRLNPTNVKDNLKKERERFLARQRRLESLAEPLNEVTAKLEKLDHALAARSVAAERKVESLESARDKRIEKIRAEYAAKIEAAKVDAQQAVEDLRTQQSVDESALLLDYAKAIVEFTHEGSAADLGAVLGVSAREAKKIIEQSQTDLAAAGIVVLPAAAPSVEDSAPGSDPETVGESTDDGAAAAIAS